MANAGEAPTTAAAAPAAEVRNARRESAAFSWVEGFAGATPVNAEAALEGR